MNSSRTLKVAALSLCLGIAACASSDVVVERHEKVVTLRPGDLEAHGIAFITPSTVTGQEHEKQAVALVFADVLARERPNVRIATLAETLNAVNRAGLSDAYRRMFEDYRDTGLLRVEALQKVASAAGARYIAHLKVQKFTQGSKNRMNILGIRVFETQIGEVRLFFQIWDSADGSVAWESMQESSITSEGFREKPILQDTIIRSAAEDLVAHLP